MGTPDQEIVIKIKVNGELLDEYARSLYVGDENDPVEGEPTPGLQLLLNQIEEVRAAITSPTELVGMDWMEREFVDEVTIELASADRAEKMPVRT